MLSYLGRLTLRLASGAARLDEERRRRHAGFLASLQNPDGGFSGRRGASDLYYTGFAVRGLGLLGALDDAIASRTAAFLATRLDRPLPCIDFLSLVFSAVLLEAFSGEDLFAKAGLDRRETVERRLLPFRRSDGGFAKTERSPCAGTYHTFLVATCLEMVGATLDRPEAMADCIRSRRRDDGGFVELPPLSVGGTNPTAAAIGLLSLLERMDPATRNDAAAFLHTMQTPEGGFLAGAKAPVSDLLSTFTALTALADLEALDSVDVPAARRFAEALELPGGGFRAGSWDDVPDAEYTFYGLGVSALSETGP